MRPEPLKKWTRPLRLRLRLAKQLPRTGRHRLKIITCGEHWDVVELRRERRHLVLIMATRDRIADDRVFYLYRAFVPVAVYLVSRAAPSVTSAVVELHDGSSVASVSS